MRVTETIFQESLRDHGSVLTAAGLQLARFIVEGRDAERADIKAMTGFVRAMQGHQRKMQDFCDYEVSGRTDVIIQRRAREELRAQLILFKDWAKKASGYKLLPTFRMIMQPGNGPSTESESEIVVAITGVNDASGETAHFLMAVAQTMKQHDIALEAIIGDITSAHFRTLSNRMAALGITDTQEVYERLCGELFKRWP